jgi:transposase-like protein
VVIYDSHEGIEAAVARAAQGQLAVVHFMRKCAGPRQSACRRVASAFIATAFARDDAEAAKLQWRKVADHLRPKVAELDRLMNEVESDVPAYSNM